jgi:hypothetical protein
MGRPSAWANRLGYVQEVSNRLCSARDPRDFDHSSVDIIRETARDLIPLDADLDRPSQNEPDRGCLREIEDLSEGSHVGLGRRPRLQGHGGIWTRWTQ